MRLAPGEQLGPYEIVAALGAGGMGEVYRARDRRLGRDVAVKILRAAGPIDDERRRRFEREARAIAALDHPNLLTVFDVGTDRNIDYLVTELLRGASLRARLDRGLPPWAEAARIAEGVARGLAAAHARGVVHRDIKPDNVFLTEDGRIKILDFGLAHVTAAELGDAPTFEQTAPGLLLGTAPYMAPEQVRGEAVSPATDLFALGAVLHESLSGASPFRRDTAAATFAAVIGEPAPPLPGVREDLARIVERCLAKRAADRPASAAEVAEALARLHTETSPRAALPALAPVSIAVLPFADLSAAHDQEYFCDGIAEEILHVLGQLSGVRVAARGSSFQFRGNHDVRAVAQRLEVDHVLEGSVRRAGDRVRVTVQLVDAVSGRPVWSERYDGDARDVFAIQEEIASCTASTLAVAITDEARRAWRRRTTDDLGAYEAYLRGRRLAGTISRADNRGAIAAFERAVDLDPGFTAAWAALAEAHALAYLWFGRAPADCARADAASARALALDPDGAETQLARAQGLAVAGHVPEAIAAFERTLAVAPTYFDALYLYGRLRFGEGHNVEAGELFERAARVRPDDYQALALATMIYRLLGDEPRTEETARRTIARVDRRLAIVPDDPRALYLGGGVQIVLGNLPRAIEMTRRAREHDPGDPTMLYGIACNFAQLGQIDEAIEAIEQAVAAGFGSHAWMTRDPDLDPLRASPRFQALLDRLPR